MLLSFVDANGVECQPAAAEGHHVQRAYWNEGFVEESRGKRWREASWFVCQDPALPDASVNPWLFTSEPIKSFLFLWPVWVGVQLSETKIVLI